MTDLVCFREDDYVLELQEDRRQPVWVAQLDDGRKAYMDDGRPGLDPGPAWLRLAAWLPESGTSIRDLWLKFRSNGTRGCLPANAGGYFFANAAAGLLNQDVTLAFMLVGAFDLTYGHVMVQRWHVPELILFDQSERDPLLADAHGFLIRNPVGNKLPH